MKIISLIVVLLCSFSMTFAGIPTLKDVRILYQQASREERSCRLLIEILSPDDRNTNALFEGYKASATMMMAKYCVNPFSKLSYFKKGKRMLEDAIHFKPDNIELRFLRFAIQSESPFFLGYNDAVEMDKKIILKAFPYIIDEDLRRIIYAYFQDCNCLSLNEKQQIKWMNY
jgi:hypothetical protein